MSGKATTTVSMIAVAHLGPEVLDGQRRARPWV